MGKRDRATKAMTNRDPQPGTHDFSAPCVEQFHQVAKHQKDQQDQQQHVDVDQNEHQDGVGNRDICTEGDHPVFHQCEDSHKHDNDDR